MGDSKERNSVLKYILVSVGSGAVCLHLWWNAAHHRPVPSDAGPHTLWSSAVSYRARRLDHADVGSSVSAAKDESAYLRHHRRRRPHHISTSRTLPPSRSAQKHWGATVSSHPGTARRSLAGGNETAPKQGKDEGLLADVDEFLSQPADDPPARANPTTHGRKNVLVLMTDDLRPDLGCYGSVVKSPNLDKLAAKSMVFDWAYSQAPSCNPSRASFVSGRRPDTTQVYRFEAGVPNEWVDLPQYFRQQGYEALGNGKVYHWIDHHHSWSNKDDYYPGDIHAWLRCETKHNSITHSTVTVSKVGANKTFCDALIADHALSSIEKAVKADKPFLAMVGFHFPHLEGGQTYLPGEEWAEYEGVNMPEAFITKAPKGQPAIACDTSHQHRNYHERNKTGASYFLDAHFGPNKSMPSDMQRELQRAYYTSITYVDKQMGRVLDLLEELGVANDTIVVLGVDHGWHNGDYGGWGKNFLLETSVHVPMIVFDPSTPESWGKRSSVIVENLDVFPTLVDLAGLPRPHTSAKAHGFGPGLEGKSLGPLLRGENVTGRGGNVTGSGEHATGSDDIFTLDVEGFALSQVPRCIHKSSHMKEAHGKNDRVRDFECRGAKPDWSKLYEMTVMGFSLRTRDWRYNAWVPFDSDKLLPQWDLPLFAEELYDHRTDRNPHHFNRFEAENLASSPDLEDVKLDHLQKIKAIHAGAHLAKYKLGH